MRLPNISTNQSVRYHVDKAIKTGTDMKTLEVVTTQLYDNEIINMSSNKWREEKFNMYEDWYNILNKYRVNHTEIEVKGEMYKVPDTDKNRRQALFKTYQSIALETGVDGAESWKYNPNQKRLLE